MFKDIPLIRVGPLMLNFGGTAEGQANFVPFKTIIPYLLGFKGWIIAGINLVGNIALLVPLGFLLPLVSRKTNWKQSLFFGFFAGFAIEVTQVILRVGIFDIDDVILNALGVLIGYGAFVIFAKWFRLKNYKAIVFTILGIIIVGVATFYGIFRGIPSRSPVSEDGVSQNEDLCGGTGGAGEIVSVAKRTFTIKRKDDSTQIVNLADNATIKTSSGSNSESDLKIGKRVTIVGGPNPGGSFTAEAIFVCN